MLSVAGQTGGSDKFFSARQKFLFGLRQPASPCRHPLLLASRTANQTIMSWRLNNLRPQPVKDRSFNEQRTAMEKTFETALRKIGLRTAAALSSSWRWQACTGEDISPSRPLAFLQVQGPKRLYVSLYRGGSRDPVRLDRTRPGGGAGISLQVPRPKDLAGNDGVTARARIVRLPYEIWEEMVLTLDDPNLTDPPIFATSSRSTGRSIRRTANG